MPEGVNFQASATSISAVGDYCVLQPGLPFLLDHATALICVAGANITAGVGAWCIVRADGTIVRLNTPAFPAISALTANSNNLYVFPQPTGLTGAPIHGLGFSITTTIVGGPIAFLQVVATSR
jgi:hypothetical protein